MNSQAISADSPSPPAPAFTITSDTPALVSEENGTITVLDFARMSIQDALKLASEITKICNVAIFRNQPDPDKDKTKQLLEVDQKILEDIQTLGKIGSSLEKSMIQFMQFYQDVDILTLILAPEILATRPSYSRLTVQFAFQLRQSQNWFQYVRVKFDLESGRLGVFCRKTPFSSKQRLDFPKIST